MKMSFSVVGGDGVLYVDKNAAYSGPHTLAARFRAFSAEISLYMYSLVGGEPMSKSDCLRWSPFMS